MHILVVEDEPALADFVARGLEDEGYTVECARDGIDGEFRALKGDVDLVILDVMLPGQDGHALLGAVRRQKPALPVIMLSARGEVGDRIEGLNGGATDYVTKPFSFDELVARVRAHLRLPPSDPSSSTTLAAAGIEIDLLTRRCWRDGNEVHLARREFDLLAFFVRNPDHVLSREEILRAVWGYEHDPKTNIVDVYVGYLRRKLGGPGRPAPIDTRPRAGYRLTTRER
jgi:DNA-binding response OmpR family regulator